MVLQSGDCLLVVHRRLFLDDGVRFFIGRVDGYDAGVAAVTGYTWVRDDVQGRLLRKSGKRTKILALASGTLIVYRLDTSAPLEQIELHSDERSNVTLTDGIQLELDLTEHLHRAR